MHIELINHCKKRNIEFISTAFDIQSVNLIQSLGQRLFKIPSGEITNFPYLEHIGKIGKPIILSTGMSTLNEIKIALEILQKAGTSKSLITVLHCTTSYPVPISDVNLLAMKTIKDEFEVKVGYSDHTLGIEIPIAAVALGASVVEKVQAGVITLMPLGNCRLARANKQADEPEFTNTPYFLPKCLAIFSSNSIERGPNPASQPSRKQASTALISSSP
jgi:hypothetical protein